VITFDLKHGQIESNGTTFDRRAFWESLGVHNIDLRLVKDDAEKKRLIDGMTFEFAFIDGAHDYASVRRDFEMVKRCGRVLFHDADDNRLRDDNPEASNAIFDFIATLPPKEITRMDIFAYWQRKAKK
jgi:hypothetical protein